MTALEAPEDLDLETSTHHQTDDLIRADKAALEDDLDDEFTDAEKAQLREDIQWAKLIKDQVDLYASYMDKYGIEAFISLFDIVGDWGMATVSTAFMLVQAKRMGLSRVDMSKIASYQAIDFVWWSVPLLGNILDFFGLKSNNRSAELFEEAYQNLINKAKIKWISDREILALESEKETAASAIWS